MRMRCPWMDVWLALWLAAGGDERLETERNFENDGLRNGKNYKICLATKHSDALERKIFSICENDMLRSGNLGFENGGLSRGTYLICIRSAHPPPPGFWYMASEVIYGFNIVRRIFLQWWCFTILWRLWCPASFETVVQQWGGGGGGDSDILFSFFKNKVRYIYHTHGKGTNVHYRRTEKEEN